MTNESPTTDAQKVAVMVTALTRLQMNLGLSHDDMSQILGIDANTWHVIKNNGSIEGTQTANVAALLLNCYQLLSNRMGADLQAMKHWLKSFNKDFQQQPLTLLKSDQGLETVVGYLAAFASRGA